MSERTYLPLSKPEGLPPMPPRPLIVWAYLAYSVVAVVYSISGMVGRDRLSLYVVIGTLVLTAIAVLLIWSASRVGWSVLAGWAVLSIPFTLSFEGRALIANVVLHTLTLGILLSPWMLRWIWRDGRPRVKTHIDGPVGRGG